MTVSIWHADDTQPIREVDFLVIGGGIIGCTVAYFAAQMGRGVVITEMRDIALGASGRNAGFMITGPDTYYHHAIDKHGHAATREIWDISQKTHTYWRFFAERHAVPLTNSGSLLLAESEDEAADLLIAARMMERDGIPIEYLSSDPLQRGYHAAIRQPFDGAVHPVRLAQAVFAESGAEMVTNNEVYAIHQESPDSVWVYSRLYRFHARHVMLCTNAYSALIEPYFVGKVIPTRGQVLATAPLKESVLPTCGYSDYGYMYYRETFDGRLLIGGGRKQNKPLENDTTDDRTTDPVQRTLEAYLKERFPEVDAPIERRWAGIMGFSLEGLPLVGVLPEKPNVGFAVGFTGHGLALGAATAERAVERLLKGVRAGVVDSARLDGR